MSHLHSLGEPSFTLAVFHIYRDFLWKFECCEMFELVGTLFPTDRIHRKFKKCDREVPNVQIDLCVIQTNENTNCKSAGKYKGILEILKSPFLF